MEHLTYSDIIPCIIKKKLKSPPLHLALLILDSYPIQQRNMKWLVVDGD